MNTPKVTERAIALAIRQYATELVAGVTLRPYQCLSEESFRTDESGGTRSYPMIEIKCGAPEIQGNQYGETVAASVRISTDENDDQNHAAISTLFGSVLDLFHSLHRQSLTPAGGDELTYFKSVFTDEFGAAFNFGGITLSAGTEPYDDDGIAVIDLGINVHYTRS
jgi:hypothetical protein